MSRHVATSIMYTTFMCGVVAALVGRSYRDFFRYMSEMSFNVGKNVGTLSDRLIKISRGGSSVL